LENFLELNLPLIKDNNPHLIEILSETQPLVNLDVIKSRKGKPIPFLCENGHEHCYHSRFDPEKEGNKLNDNYKPGGVKIFLGLGGAYHITPFLENSKILIIESRADHLKALLTLIDFSHVFSRKNVMILCEPEKGYLSQWLKNNYMPLLDGHFSLIPLRSQIRFDQKSFDNYALEIDTALKQIAADCSTQKRLGRLWQRNILSNFSRAIKSPLRLPLKKNSREAVLIAAGPTLSNHREYIKNLSEDILLMAVDTVLPVLNQWGIISDYVITLDPQFIGYLHFMSSIPSKSILLAEIGCSLPSSIGNVQWFSSPHPLISYLTEDASPFITLKGGVGNVTQAALEILVGSGIEKITLLGADFSYPQGKPYVEGSYFYPWYETRSLRTAPLENHITQYILKQSNLTKSGKPGFPVYKTDRLEAYENEMVEFVLSFQGEIRKKAKGIRKIKTDFSPRINTSLGNYHIGQLKSYKEKLSRLKDMKNEPEWTTLLPLAYSYYDENSSQAQENALKKALEYTMKLLNTYI
jgi:hypothetical protein